MHVNNNVLLLIPLIQISDNDLPPQQLTTMPETTMTATTLMETTVPATTVSAVYAEVQPRVSHATDAESVLLTDTVRNLLTLMTQDFCIIVRL